MRALFITLSLLSLFVTGCTSIETVKESKGQGTKRVYSYPYERVFSATLSAAAQQKLEVVESDRGAKRIVLSHGTTWMSWGENIAIFLEPKTETSTEVEIVSKPVMTPLNFPPEWEKILLEQIEAELRSK